MAEYISDEFLHTGEYISRDDTLTAMQYSCQNCDNYNGVRCKACADADNMDIVSDMPAADVKHVIHAKWVLFDKDCVGRAFYCSNCRKVTTTDDFEDTPLDRDEYFCPRCGADMRNE